MPNDYAYNITLLDFYLVLRHVNDHKDVDVAKLWAQAMTPLCPSLQYSFSQSYQIQLPTEPHFGFRSFNFSSKNYIQYPDSAKIYLIVT